MIIYQTIFSFYTAAFRRNKGAKDEEGSKKLTNGDFILLRERFGVLFPARAPLNELLTVFGCCFFFFSILWNLGPIQSFLIS